MARFKEGDRVYIPSNINKIRYDATRNLNVYEVEYLDATGEKRFADIDDEPGLLLTADEIIDANIIQAQDNDKARYEEAKKRCERALNDVVELGREIKALKSENERLSKQNEELGVKVDDLEVKLNNARAAIDLLQEENNKLKQEVEVRKGMYKRQMDNRTEYLHRITVQEEVIVALVEKIRRLEGDD